MRLENKRGIAWLGGMLLIGMLVICVANTEALEPRLLWRKNLPFEILALKMASESGDIIVSSKEPSQVVLYDRDGNRVFHWGPRVDRVPLDVDISSKGAVVVYTTSWSERTFWEKKVDISKYGWDHTVHYVDRRGKEKWRNKLEDVNLYLSPDGSLVGAGASPGNHGGLTMWDAAGKVLWRWREDKTIVNLVFSPDGNYMVASTGGVYLLDRNGGQIWERGTGTLFTVSVSGSYVSILDAGEENAVYDRQGKVILKKKAVLCPDGSKVLTIEPGRMNLMRLPHLEQLKTLPIEGSTPPRPFLNASFSYSGAYLAVSGKIEASASNLFVIQTATGEIWGTEIRGEIHSADLTRDGKYMLVVNGASQLNYFQIY